MSVTSVCLQEAFSNVFTLLTFLITDTSIQYLLKKCAILEVLDISGGQTLTKSALTDNVLISIGNYGKNLQQLTIHNNDKITMFGIRELLRTSTSLKSVSFTAQYRRKTRLGISLHDCESIVVWTINLYHS
jgi:hypothetical protein